MIRTFLLGATLMASSIAHAGGIAVVDFERAVQETNEGKAAQARLDTMYASRKAEVERMRDEYQKMVEDYQSRALVLSEDARRQAEGDLVRKQQGFEAKYGQYQQEMQQTYMDLLSDLDKKMRALTETIAKEKSYDVVLDKAAVVYAGGAAVDMTDTLITRYNSK